MGNDAERAAPMHVIERRSAGALSEFELQTAVELLRNGAAVDPNSAARTLPRSTVVLVHRGDLMVGVGAIKPVRPRYFNSLLASSNAVAGSALPELGYVTVAATDRRRDLSTRIVAALLDGFCGGLFATTGNPAMERTLSRFSFAVTGQPWEGERGPLRLWLRPAVDEG